MELRYGVMVALQILVLSVQVRILVSQPFKGRTSILNVRPLKIEQYYILLRKDKNLNFKEFNLSLASACPWSAALRYQFAAST